MTSSDPLSGHAVGASVVAAAVQLKGAIMRQINKRMK
jgi:hypothetical protein